MLAVICRCRDFFRFGPDRKTNAAKVSAGELINGFLINEDSANRYYSGRLVELTGTVQHICRDTEDEETYLVFTSETVGTPYAVACYLNEQISSLQDIETGDSVTVRGICKGIDGYSVLICDCVPE